jgi:hypothetical protein
VAASVAWMYLVTSNLGAMENIVENSFVRLELLENGILVAEYKRQRVVTLPMAREIVQTRLNFVGREPRPVLVLNLGVVEFDKEARNYVSTGDGIAGISAAAIVVNNLATQSIISLILTVERPTMPVRAYTQRGRAMRWLETFL